LPFPASAKGIPTYSQIAEALPDLWKRRFPLQEVRFLSDPEKRGILSASDGGRMVYYYHFRAMVSRPVRNPDESIGLSGERSVELWVRYRPERGDGYDLTFIRRDLLPGKNKRWIK
jgi:hypothetical protein